MVQIEMYLDKGFSVSLIAIFVKQKQIYHLSCATLYVLQFL